MPESVNGMAVAGMGHMEGKTGDHFLFTSESVGEGHPGMLSYSVGHDNLIFHLKAYDVISFFNISKLILLNIYDVIHRYVIYHVTRNFLLDASNPSLIKKKLGTKSVNIVS